MNKIPNRIKELRKQKGVTLNDLSLATGFTTSSISRWEEGSRGFDKEKAILIAKILEVKPSELFISDENNFQTYWNTEKNITFRGDKYIVSIMRKGKKYSRSFDKLEEAIRHRDIILKDYKETGILPKTRTEEIISSYRELIGKKFRRLTVIDIVGPKKKKDVKRTYTYLLCHCDCGNTCEVEIFNLLKGTILSCGCLALEKSQEIGKRFGKDSETSEKARVSNILNSNPRKTNKTTQIKNITYSPKLKSYRVQITRRGVHYTKRFPSLAEAIDYKEVVLNQLDKDVRQKQVKK
ncbi:TPA: helix-turn-helix transcriptional regulator [Streptococcus agalactiae]|nr:helix-turn-helix transcriptional regulator [Streptococcus agalactiae]